MQQEIQVNSMTFIDSWKIVRSMWQLSEFVKYLIAFMSSKLIKKILDTGTNIYHCKVRNVLNSEYKTVSAEWASSELEVGLLLPVRPTQILCNFPLWHCQLGALFLPLMSTQLLRESHSWSLQLDPRLIWGPTTWVVTWRKEAQEERGGTSCPIYLFSMKWKKETS